MHSEDCMVSHDGSPGLAHVFLAREGQFVGTSWTIIYRTQLSVPSIVTLAVSCDEGQHYSMAAPLRTRDS